MKFYSTVSFLWVSSSAGKLGRNVCKSRKHSALKQKYALIVFIERLMTLKSTVTSDSFTDYNKAYILSIPVIHPIKSK